MAAHQGTDLTVAGMCAAAAKVLRVSGAGILLIGDDGASTRYVSSSRVQRLEELQVTIGVGPGFDAYRQQVPIVEADLVAFQPPLWSGFAEAAIIADVRAVFSFPLQVGAVRVGALTLYEGRAGLLDAERYADALVMAGVVMTAVLGIQTGVAAGHVPAEMSAGDLWRPEVHQAAGMVSAQLDIGVGEAMVRLRARAFASDTPLHRLAADVVARRLRFA